MPLLILPSSSDERSAVEPCNASIKVFLCSRQCGVKVSNEPTVCGLVLQAATVLNPMVKFLTKSNDNHSPVACAARFAPSRWPQLSCPPAVSRFPTTSRLRKTPVIVSTHPCFIHGFASNIQTYTASKHTPYPAGPFSTDSLRDWTIKAYQPLKRKFVHYKPKLITNNSFSKPSKKRILLI